MVHHNVEDSSQDMPVKPASFVKSFHGAPKFLRGRKNLDGDTKATDKILLARPK